MSFIKRVCCKSDISPTFFCLEIYICLLFVLKKATFCELSGHHNHFLRISFQLSFAFILVFFPGLLFITSQFHVFSQQLRSSFNKAFSKKGSKPTGPYADIEEIATPESSAPSSPKIHHDGDNPPVSMKSSASSSRYHTRIFIIVLFICISNKELNHNINKYKLLVNVKTEYHRKLLFSCHSSDPCYSTIMIIFP